MRTTCRVPLQLLALRLSILYLRTCVGLGYGNLITLSKLKYYQYKSDIKLKIILNIIYLIIMKFIFLVQLLPLDYYIHSLID